MAKIIADLTKANPNTEASLIQALDDFLGPLVPSQTVAVCHLDQQYALQSFGNRVAISPIRGPRHWQAVVNEILDKYIRKELNSGANDGPISIVSFHPAVLDLGKSIPPGTKSAF